MLISAANWFVPLHAHLQHGDDDDIGFGPNLRRGVELAPDRHPRDLDDVLIQRGACDFLDDIGSGLDANTPCCHLTLADPYFFLEKRMPSARSLEAGRRSSISPAAPFVIEQPNERAAVSEVPKAKDAASGRARRCRTSTREPGPLTVILEAGAFRPWLFEEQVPSCFSVETGEQLPMCSEVGMISVSALSTLSRVSCDVFESRGRG